MNLLNKNNCITLALLLTALSSFSQKSLLMSRGDTVVQEYHSLPESSYKRDYKIVDSCARSLSGMKFSKMEILADTISNRFNSEADKVRAIFIWITENIAYDCEKYHVKEPGQVFDATNKKKYMEAVEKWNLERAKQCFKKKKGVCEDYSLLFKYLCTYAGIESIVVKGYANDPYKPARRLGDHSWNKVKIEGEWYVLDVTWASGFADRKVTKFTKKFDAFYFLPSPLVFEKTHVERK